MVVERGGPYRIILENVIGPASYPEGGFLTGTHTSALQALRIVVDAMGAGMSVTSGQISGAAGINVTSSPLYHVQSAGISGNQIGIRCYSLSGVQSGQNTYLAEMVSGINLQGQNFKVLLQGY